MAQGQLAKTTEEVCSLMSMMVLDALLSIGDSPDSQVIDRTEIRRRCTCESLSSLDLVSLILWFKAPNFSHR